jgi:hypothetical protein
MTYYLYWTTGLREEVTASELAQFLALTHNDEGGQIESFEPVRELPTDVDIAMM